MKSDSHIEKSFLYLLVFSLMLHIGAFALLLYLPEKKETPKEPVFIDLQEMPELKRTAPQIREEAKRLADQQIRVQRETAPRASDTVDRGAGSRGQQYQKPRPTETVTPGSSLQSLFKSKTEVAREQHRPQLFPGSSRMAHLEESYRRKFEKDVADGDTKFLNSDDIQFGSFLRRFENAIYGVWRYPQEAIRRGIEGVTPVKITFNRKGEILRVTLLESSGSKILDDEVLRTLKDVGPVGSFPRGYQKDEFNLIAFFQYGGSSRRSLR